MRKQLRYLFSLIGIVLLFGAVAVAPMSAEPQPAAAGMFFEPGKMPPQSIITAASEEADLYLKALKVEHVPEPEPDPQPEPLTPPETPPASDTQNNQEPEVAPAPEPEPEPRPSYSGGGSPEVWMTAAGIDPGDWGYVDFIASKESGWNPDATNPTSGACGLIQAYPCSKVPGSGYDPVDNLSWANGYAVDRYGSWEQAYAFWQANWWW